MERNNFIAMEERKEEGDVEGEGDVERQCRTLRSFLNELRIELIFSWDGGGDRGWEAGGKTNHGACLAYRTLPTSHPYVKSLSGSPVDDAQAVENICRRIILRSN